MRAVVLDAARQPNGVVRGSRGAQQLLRLQRAVFGLRPAPVGHGRRSCSAPPLPQRLVVRATAAPVAEGISAFEELASSSGPQYIMISGKGGVGKTSLAASLGVQFAERGLRCLVVSTDPAHSLGDSFAQDLAGGAPVRIDGAPNLCLWGLEIDPEKEKDRFRAYAATSGKQDVKDALGPGGFALGAIVDQLADLKLGELLDTPPPGFDEAVAIAKVQELVTKSEEKWDRIIFDTAPTGHTLRLLTVPDFVEASLKKITRLRRKLSSASSTVKSLFGAGAGQEEAVDKLEQMQASIRMVKDLFHDQKNTEFVIATIPTVLGLNESARLIRALRREGIPCRRIVVNQLLRPSMGAKYLEMKEKDQARALAMIDSDPELKDLRKLTVPYIDRETRGVPALQYFGQLLWGPVLDEFGAGSQRKYFMLGGKGGVGKTTSAASLGITLGMAAPSGAALIISTDPAHSLSDALDQDVSSGRPVEVAGTDGRVYGLELDLEQAKQELKALSGKDQGRTLDRVLSSVGLGAVAGQLEDLRLGELLETPPPGVDEAIAISKVIQLLKDPEYSKFTRIVFDTAPTGHTLRLLSLPDFLDTSVGKILALQQKLSSLASSMTKKVTSLVTGADSSEQDGPSSFDRFKESVAEVQQVFRDPDNTSFIVVSIATVMAAAESSRLVHTLRKERVPVQTMVLNQVLQPLTSEKFLEQRMKDQQRALEQVQADPELQQLQLIEAPLLELEVRGVPALQYFGNIVWK